jgi:AcrR family transcriptional regulator
VDELQRARLIAAIIETVGEHGYADLTVARVVARAKVSRKTFYDIFTGREDGFLAAFEQAADRMRTLAAEAFASQPNWRRGLRASLQQLLLFLDEEPGVARLAVVDALGAGERVLARRIVLLAEAARSIDAARTPRADLPTISGQAAVGGAFAILHSHIALRGPEPVSDLHGALMSTIILPYLGSRAAQRELEIECPRRPLKLPPSPATHQDPLKGLQVRVTYRTVRAMMSIAESPGCSNRAVANSAGIADQGQISKLLTRLESLDLIRNGRDARVKRVENAWFLTARGVAFEKAMRPA